MSDDQRRFLEVRRRQIDLNSSRLALQRAQENFKQGLIAYIDVERAKTDVDKAQLDYQEAVLSLLSLQPRLSVKQAMKYQTRDETKVRPPHSRKSNPNIRRFPIQAAQQFRRSGSNPGIAAHPRCLGYIYFASRGGGDYGRK